MFRLYIPIWTIKDENLRHRTQGILILYIPIWTIKDRLRGSAAPSAFWFTFQYGRLKTKAGYDRIGLSPSFTFQYGRLKTVLLSDKADQPYAFTFQYGRLKTRTSLSNDTFYLCLHSNMDD